MPPISQNVAQPLCLLCDTPTLGRRMLWYVDITRPGLGAWHLPCSQSHVHAPPNEWSLDQAPLDVLLTETGEAGLLEVLSVEISEGDGFPGMFGGHRSTVTRARFYPMVGRSRYKELASPRFLLRRPALGAWFPATMRYHHRLAAMRRDLGGDFVCP